MNILFCTKNVLHRGKVLKKGFVRRGGTIFHGEDLSAVVLWRVYVGSLEMWKKPIGKGDTKVSPVWVLYRDWLYRTKSSKKFWKAKLGGGCWRYRGPIAMDDTREWPVWAWYRSWPYRRKFESRKCVKNLLKWRILLVWDAPGSVLSET